MKRNRREKTLKSGSYTQKDTSDVCAICKRKASHVGVFTPYQQHQKLFGGSQERPKVFNFYVCDEHSDQESILLIQGKILDSIRKAKMYRFLNIDRDGRVMPMAVIRGGRS